MSIKTGGQTSGGLQNLPVIAGLMGWWQQSAPPAQFWLLVLATFLFNAGVSVFFFLFNLLMLNLGFRERSLGIFASATALGSVAGTLPMGIMAERLGLKKVLAACLLLTGAAFGARVYLIWPAAQIAFCFFDGIVLCGWVVCLSPAVAWLVEERKRPLAFSILFAVAVAAGAAGGFAGGNAPLWCQHIGHHWAAAISDTEAKRITILLAAAVTALAAWPVVHLRSETRPRAVAWVRRPSPFLVRFLVATACWGAVLGAFNPFTNVFFSLYLGVATSHLGNFFAVVQLVQAGAVLLMPLVVRRMGLIRGLFLTQIITAAALGALSGGRGLWSAGLFYCVFMAGQHMGDPAIQSLLMRRVAPSLRSEAAAMSFLVLSVGQAAAAAGGGIAFAHFHHSQVIAGLAIAAAGAAFLFHWLCGQETDVAPAA